MEKMPPRKKIHEALSAIADRRVLLGEGSALVESSGSGKQYTVTWTGDVFTSNDSATYWQLYPRLSDHCGLAALLQASPQERHRRVLFRDQLDGIE